MPSSRKRLLASVLGYALMAAGTGLAGEIPTSEASHLSTRPGQYVST